MFSTSGLDFRPEMDAVASENDIIWPKNDWHRIDVYFYDRVRHLTISGSTGSRAKMATESESRLNIDRNEVFQLYPVGCQDRKLASWCAVSLGSLFDGLLGLN